MAPHTLTYTAPQHSQKVDAVIHPLQGKQAKKQKSQGQITIALFGILAGLVAIAMLTNPLRSPNRAFTSGTWGWGLGLFLFGQLLVFMTTRPEWRIFAIQCALLVLGGLTYGFILVQNTLNPNLVVNATRVCNGQNLPKAAAYRLNDAPHRMLAVYISSEQSLLVDAYPPGWIPEKVEDLQLVACIEETWDVVQKCPYEGNSVVEREQHRLIVTLRSAQDGQEISTFQLYGSAPPECALVETFEKYQKTKTRRGAEVELSQLMDWLGSFVNP